MGLSADAWGNEMFSGARECICVACREWGKDRKKEFQECSYKGLKKPKVIRPERKRKKW